MTDIREDHKAIVAAIKQTQELMKAAGLEVSTDGALLALIYQQVRPQKEDRLGKWLAKIEGQLGTLLGAIQKK